MFVQNKYLCPIPYLIRVQTSRLYIEYTFIMYMKIYREPFLQSVLVYHQVDYIRFTFHCQLWYNCFCFILRNIMKSYSTLDFKKKLYPQPSTSTLANVAILVILKEQKIELRPQRPLGAPKVGKKSPTYHFHSLF